MDFYIIPPLKNLQLMHNGDRYFCLAQLYASDKEYKTFFKSLSESWITLDNGAGDHDLVSEDALFKVMKDLKPNEVIPPDILFEKDATIESAKKFIQRMKDEGLFDQIEVLFCPQGATREEWIECYTWGLENEDVATIGLSKIAVPRAWFQLGKDEGIMEARHNCFNYLKVNKLLQKPLHLLGSGNPLEFQYYQQFDEGSFVRSSDSCNSVWSAMNGLDWTEGQFDRIPTPKNYFDRKPLTQKQLIIAENNIDFLQERVG